MNFVPSTLLSNGGLSLTRILGSASRAIGIARQIAPIYRDIKPLIKKVPVLFERLASIRNTAYTYRDYDYYNEDSKENIGDYNIIDNVSNLGPTFFQ